MSEQQEYTPFDYNSIPGYAKLTELEKELDKIEKECDKLTSKQLTNISELILITDKL